jgi:hypothetical protein
VTFFGLLLTPVFYYVVEWARGAADEPARPHTIGVKVDGPAAPHGDGHAQPAPETGIQAKPSPPDV